MEFKCFYFVFKFIFGYFGFCDVVFFLKVVDVYLKESLYFVFFMNVILFLDLDDVCSMMVFYNRLILYLYNVFFVMLFKVKCVDSGYCVME